MERTKSLLGQIKKISNYKYDGGVSSFRSATGVSVGRGSWVVGRGSQVVGRGTDVVGRGF